MRTSFFQSALLDRRRGAGFLQAGTARCTNLAVAPPYREALVGLKPGATRAIRNPPRAAEVSATGRNRRRAEGLGFAIFALGALTVQGAVVAPAFAQKGGQPAGVTVSADQGETSLDAQRGAFDRFLDAHPEIEDEVLGDPPRLSDPNYVRDHPALQAFLESHPMVKADPRAFLSPGTWRFVSHRSSDEELLSWFVPFAVFVCCLLAVLWVLRAILENRRWNKSFRVHEEMHTKLIEKFASGPELSAYLETGAARRLLEWTPPAFDAPSRSLPAAAGRIIGSLQAGLVLLLVGLGLLLVRNLTPPPDAQPFLVLGTLGVTIGAGFILSALASYVLSRRLGLIGGVTPGSAASPNR